MNEPRHLTPCSLPWSRACLLVSLITGLLDPAPAAAEVQRRWEPESFSHLLHASAQARTRFSIHMRNESRWSDGYVTNTASEKNEGQAFYLRNRLAMGPDLEVAVLDDRLSIFAMASFLLESQVEDLSASSYWSLDSALAGLKLSGSLGPVHAAAGLGAGLVNLDPDAFAAASGLWLRGLVTAQGGRGVVRLGIVGVLDYTTRTDDGDDYETLRLTFSGRLALFVTRWFSLQAELSAATLLDRSAGPAASAGDVGQLLLDGVAGLRFGRNHINMGLGASVPITHRELRPDLGVVLDLSVML